MSSSDRDTGFSGFAAGLLVLCAVMVGVGFVLPSSGSADAGYHPMSEPTAPLRLVVPALKIRAPIKPIEVNDDRVLDPPRNPRDVGWWVRSARPGATTGQTVLTGHTVHTGGGVMDDLGQLRKGQLVKVRTRNGTMVYRTTRVVTWSKQELAERAVEIFSQQREHGRLVLITCSQWNGHAYKSNVVVFADPLGVPNKPAQKKD
jgi:LPXTG-site transpeptidase (sortase) family protein